MHPVIPKVTPGNEMMAVAQHLATIDPAQDRALRLYRYQRAQEEPNRPLAADVTASKEMREAATLSDLPWMTPAQEQHIKEKELVEKLAFRRNTGRDDASVLSDEKTLLTIVESGHDIEPVVGSDAQRRRHRPSSSALEDLHASFRSLKSFSDKGSVHSADDAASPTTKTKRTRHGSSARALAIASTTASVLSQSDGRLQSASRNKQQEKWCLPEDEDVFQHSSSPMMRITNIRKRMNLVHRTAGGDSSSYDSDSEVDAPQLLRFRKSRAKYDPDAETYKGIDLERYDPDL
jgi:hypothetical protein